MIWAYLDTVYLDEVDVVHHVDHIICDAGDVGDVEGR